MIHMDINTSYKTLGIYPGSSVEEIKNAYKTQVKTFHPDLYVNKGSQQKDAQEKLILVNLAYETIRSHLEEKAAPLSMAFKPEQYCQENDQPSSIHDDAGKMKYDNGPKTLHKTMYRQMAVIDRNYHLAKIRANERITTKIQKLTEAEAEINDYLKHIDKKYFGNGYDENQGNKKAGFGKLKKLFLTINNKIG